MLKMVFFVEHEALCGLAAAFSADHIIILYQIILNILSTPSHASKSTPFLHGLDKYLLGKTRVIPPSVATNLATTPCLTSREDKAIKHTVTKIWNVLDVCLTFSGDAKISEPCVLNFFHLGFKYSTPRNT